MTELKSTQIALVTSVISLLLSCVMLLGTTYAWFVDSVSSSNNRIIAGNLDIDLLMYKEDEEEYVSIADGSGDIFAESNGGVDVNWEPDKTEIVYLAVKNIGSLALKYNIKLDVDGELAGALEYAILDDVKPENVTSTDWTAIQSNPKAQKGQLKATDRLNHKDETDYFAIVVHMPDDAENQFQGKSVTVDLTLVATQASYEKDSFGEDYDEDITSEMPVVTIDTFDEFKAFTESVNAGGKYDGVKISNNADVYVKLTTDIDLSSYTDFVGIGDGKNNSFDGIFDGCDHIIKNWTEDNQDKPLALFRTTNGADIKNLTIDNFIVGADTTKGNNYSILIGLIEGDDVVIDRVSIKNSVLTGQETIGVIVGAITEGHLTITNCKIEDVTIKNAEGYTGVVGILLGNGKDSDECSFVESRNETTNVNWFNADIKQATVPAYNYEK